MKKYLILDTDIGSDCDDTLALAYLVYATKKLGVELSAITYSHTCPHGIATIRALLRSLNAEIPPIGKMPCEWIEKENYSKKVAEKFAKEIDYADVSLAVPVLRTALAQKEKSVICAIGPLTNISELINSSADEASCLSGVELLKEKCEKIVIMGGCFEDGTDGVRAPEWNFKMDANATKNVVENCPVPIVFLPFEVGVKVLTGGKIMEKYGENSPLSLSFVSFGDTKVRGGRFSWDPLTALYAVEGGKDFLREGNDGKVTVDKDGTSYFAERVGGLHRVLGLNSERDEQECIKALSEYIDECALAVCEQN